MRFPHGHSPELMEAREEGKEGAEVGAWRTKGKKKGVGCKGART